MTNFDPSNNDPSLSDGFSVFARIALGIGAVFALLFVTATAAGYISVLIEQRSADAVDVAVIGGLALVFGGIAYAIWRLWRRDTSADLPPSGPGEIRTRQRSRTQMIYIAFAGTVGGMIGLATGIFDQGDGSLFGGDWEQLKLPPLLAIGVAIMVLGGFVALPLYGFRMIDDYKREQNLVAFTGGCLSVIAGFPVWAVLHAGGLVPPPHAFGIFALAYVSMILSFLYARWRL